MTCVIDIDKCLYVEKKRCSGVCLYTIMPPSLARPSLCFIFFSLADLVHCIFLQIIFLQALWYNLYDLETFRCIGEAGGAGAEPSSVSERRIASPVSGLDSAGPYLRVRGVSNNSSSAARFGTLLAFLMLP